MSYQLAAGLLHLILPLMLVPLNIRFVYIFLSNKQCRSQECYRIMIQIGIVQCCTVPGFLCNGLYLLIGHDFCTIFANIIATVGVAIRLDCLLDCVLAVNRLRIMCELRYPISVHKMLTAIVWLYAAVLLGLYLFPTCGIVLKSLLPSHDPFRTKVTKIAGIVYWFTAFVTLPVYIAIVDYALRSNHANCTTAQSTRQLPILIYAVAKFSADITISSVFYFMPHSQTTELLLGICYMLRCLALSPILYLLLFKSVKKEFFGINASCPMDVCQSDEVERRKAGIFRDSTRYAVLVICLICMTLVMSNTLALNFTIICMGSENENVTTVYDYSQSEKGWLFSAVAIGSLIGTIPITELFTTYGARKVKTAYGLISAVATLLSPWAASQGFYWLFAVRAIQGFALTMTYSASGAITAHWATLEKSGIYMALLSCHLQFSPMFTMPVAGAFCVSSIGWTGVYYLQGFLTLFFFALFYYFYRDTPRMHKIVSAKELGKIESGKTGIGAKPKRTPYLAICKDLCIIGAWISWVGGAAAFQIFLQYGPTYLNKVLHYEVAKTGFATAIPYLLSFIVKVVAGPFSDYATCLSERARLIVFTVVSQGTMALCFVIMALIPTDQAFVGWCAYTAAITFSGLNCVGIFKCAQMVSRQYLTFVMSVFSIINSLSVLILPPFVSLLVPTNDPSEWALVFYIICGLVVVTNLFFCFVCKADPAPWTKDQDADAAKTGNDMGPKKF